MSHISRVQAFIIGVSKYDSDGLENLPGAAEDVAQLKYLFTNNETGLYSNDQLTVMVDPTLNELRVELLDYVEERSAKGDICVFYFAGHGCVLSGNEFAFCLRDARLRADGGDVLPLSVMKFRDVLDTLATADVIPVVIVDACNSGLAGWANPTSVKDTLGSMHDQLLRSAGTTYAILCACSDRHAAIGDDDGGAFTSALVEVLENGLTQKPFLRKKTLSLSDIFPLLHTACEKLPDIGLPRLHVSPDLPAFEICQNVGYKRLAYTFSRYMKSLVSHLWNGGNPIEMTISDIREFGAGPYGNHSKLSYEPWGLVEDVTTGGKKKRALTARGRDFAINTLKIPREIEADSTAPTGFRASPGADLVSIADIE